MHSTLLSGRVTVDTSCGLSRGMAGSAKQSAPASLNALSASSAPRPVIHGLIFADKAQARSWRATGCGDDGSELTRTKSNSTTTHDASTTDSSLCPLNCLTCVHLHRLPSLVSFRLRQSGRRTVRRVKELSHLTAPRCRVDVLTALICLAASLYNAVISCIFWSLAHLYSLVRCNWPIYERQTEVIHNSTR